MRCLGCGSGFHGDAGNGRRRIRHSARPACGVQATYRAEWYEEQLARSFDDLRFDEVNIEQVLVAMRQFHPPPSRRTPTRS